MEEGEKEEKLTTSKRPKKKHPKRNLKVTWNESSSSLEDVDGNSTTCLVLPVIYDNPSSSKNKVGATYTTNKAFMAFDNSIPVGILCY